MKKYRIYILIIFCILILLLHYLPFNKLGTGYIEQQWFVNYSSGFIRRGLFGEINKWINVDLEFLYIFFRCLISILFLLFFGIVKQSFGQINNKNFLYFLLIVTSPIFYSAYAKLNGRFDLIFSLVITLIFLIKNDNYSNRVILLSIIPLGLIHEIWLILYVPMYYVLTAKDKFNFYQYCILCFNFIFLLMLWWFTHIPPTDTSEVCKDISIKLIKLDYVCISHIHISFSTQSISEALNGTFFKENTIKFLSIAKRLIEFFCTIVYIFLASASIWFVLYRAKNLTIINKNKVFSLTFIFIIISILAQDWGRFLVDMIQIIFIYIFIKSQLNFDMKLEKKYFIIFLFLNIIFIKLVFTNISIFNF